MEEKAIKMKRNKLLKKNRNNGIKMYEENRKISKNVDERKFSRERNRSKCEI